jgi:hypothetical protein
MRMMIIAPTAYMTAFLSIPEQLKNSLVSLHKYSHTGRK